MDGLNEYRAIRVGDLLADFRNLQYYIAAVPVDPPNQEDYYTEGWAALRQCAIDGENILATAMEMRPPSRSLGDEENEKAQLQITYLDAFSRRHESQKIYLRQEAVQRWIENRERILQGGRPHSGVQAQLRACDQRLRAELASITDEAIYNQLRNEDIRMGRWTAEDPSLRRVQHWLQSRVQH